MLRYLKHLENKDLSLAHAMISLGSCTMKLNATTEMIPVTWPEFGDIHPFAPTEQVGGYHRLIEELELDHITLVAHDWGGAIGMGAAVRMSARISKIVLMNTAAFPSKFIPKRIAACRIPFLGALGVRGFNAFAGAAITQAVANKKVWTPAAKAGYLAPYDNWANRVAVHRFVQDIPMQESHPSYVTLKEISDILDQFNETPIKLIWGMQDWCFHPEFLREFQRRWPHAETVELDHAHHYLFEDDPQRCLEEIKQFLSN